MAGKINYSTKLEEGANNHIELITSIKVLYKDVILMNGFSVRLNQRHVHKHKSQ